MSFEQPLGSLAQDKERGSSCMICGNHMNQNYEMDKKRLRKILTQTEQWRACSATHGHVTGRTSDLSSMYLSPKECWMWRGLRRAGMTSRLFRSSNILTEAVVERGTEWHLTGVAMSGPWSRNLLRLPKDGKEHFIGNPWHAPDKFVEAHAGNLWDFTRSYPIYAHGMHERCWVLATRTLDVDLIQEHLDLFIQALYRVPKNHVPPLGRMDHSQDPWKIVDIPKFICREEKVENDIRATSSLTCSKETKERRSPSISVAVSADVILMIMDLLEGCWEMRALMWAFPHWAHTVPQSYWRYRFIRDLMLEGDPLPEAHALNWRLVYYKLDRLVEGSVGLLDRQRIVGILQKAEGILRLDLTMNRLEFSKP